jgi:hypothetical protein
LLHVALLLIAVHQIGRVWSVRGDLGAVIRRDPVRGADHPLLRGLVVLGRAVDRGPDAGGDAEGRAGQAGRGALAVAAIASPYCLSPRPFARSMTRCCRSRSALVVAGVGAAALRLDYVHTVKVVNNVLGLDLRVDAPQDQIALYLLAFATITWTVAACATAASPARRRLGLGLLMLVLAGYGFAWPAAFVTAAVGLVLMGDGAVRVRTEGAPPSSSDPGDRRRDLAGLRGPDGDALRRWSATTARSARCRCAVKASTPRRWW